MLISGMFTEDIPSTLAAALKWFHANGGKISPVRVEHVVAWRPNYLAVNFITAKKQCFFVWNVIQDSNDQTTEDE